VTCRRLRFEENKGLQEGKGSHTAKSVSKILFFVALVKIVLNLSCTIAAGGRHTVGILPDGRVIATGNNDEGQCNVSGWTNITQVAAGFSHTVELKDDATVVATGRNIEGQCNVLGWTDISMVVAGDWHTVARKDDGTVVATGKSDEGQCNVGGWILKTPSTEPHRLITSSFPAPMAAR